MGRMVHDSCLTSVNISRGGKVMLFLIVLKESKNILITESWMNNDNLRRRGRGSKKSRRRKEKEILFFYFWWERISIVELSMTKKNQNQDNP